MRRHYAYATVVIPIVLIIIASQVPVTVTPELSKGPYGDSEEPINWVGRDESLRANFSGHFYVVVTRDFDRIRLWITPRESARTLNVRVEVKREYLNDLYLEVEPPWYGEVEIIRGENQNGMRYIIQVKNFGEAGKGTYELTFIDKAPEDRISMHITVETRDGLIKYRGELPVVILEPFYRFNCTD